MAFFSPAQVLGYLAFVLGVAAFLQRVDRRLKLLLACESLAYTLHFVLLGNPPAASSTAVTAVRSLLATRYRSPWLAAAIIAVNVALGAVLVRGPTGWIPVVAGSLGTVALFTLHGVTMRLVLLGCTALWLVNNILSGSIGGTLLEAVIAMTSLFTLGRMMIAARERGGRGPTPAPARAAAVTAVAPGAGPPSR